MTEEAQAAPEAGAAPEAVTPEADQASEATENTEGQTDAEQPAEDDGKPEAEEKSERTTRNQRRKAQMDRVKQEAKEAQERADKAERELARLKGVESTPPKMEDFTDHDEYLAELSAYKAEQRMNSRQVQEAEREAAESKKQTEDVQKRQAEEAAQNWAAQSDEARTRYADFDAVVQAPDVSITPDMAHLIALSDNGADVAYHLGMNKELARELAQMPAPELVGAMRMLERTVTAQTPKPRTTTQAPAPVNPVKGKSSGLKDPKDMTMAEYKAARAAGKI
ncbi:hypothetical protein [Leisingera sp. ANG-M7]|uniref:hypothetical protein n=1 Tax=Leisingera sp. ANG-M7 TaxID=1577902 RepID=UPI00057FB1E5|nr:hypothetical protein [Leisingera sp. ANG-M7]KIC39362.1 hypothetical protein RA26_01545 [Leisingera sp. ANG-M7]